MRPVFIGLDYSAVRSIAESLDIELSPRMIARIKFLESLELKRLNKEEA